MGPRARIPLLCVYLLLAVCGLVSIYTPVDSVASTLIPILVKAWGAFFLVGGAVSAGALIARWVRKSALGWWYIEISGICLLATSSLLYASVLLAISIEKHSLGIFSLVCVILSLTASLVGRAMEAYHIVKAERIILEDLRRRDREG